MQKLKLARVQGRYQREAAPCGASLWVHHALAHAAVDHKLLPGDKARPVGVSKESHQLCHVLGLADGACSRREGGAQGCTQAQLNCPRSGRAAGAARPVHIQLQTAAAALFNAASGSSQPRAPVQCHWWSSGRSDPGSPLVSTHPGQTQLTRALPASDAACACVRPTRPAFDAAYPCGGKQPAACRDSIASSRAVLSATRAHDTCTLGIPRKRRGRARLAVWL